jgi:RND family efflux transporter MFP subunit
MRYVSRRTWFAALLVSLSLGALACGRHVEPAQATERPAADLAVEVAALEPVAQDIEATGSIHPRVRVAPGTKILGRVDRVAAEIGQRVEKGQTLAELERRDLEAAVEQARAAVVMAEARLDNARAHHERMLELHDRGSATDKSVEDATSAFRVAEAAVLQAQANRSAAEVTLGYATIRSPIAGYVTGKLVESGDMARPGEPMFVVEDLSRVEVVATVPESGVVGLEAGDRARVAVDVLDLTLEAVVKSVNPAGDPLSRTFEVRLRLDNPDGRLKSGMFVRTSFERGSREGLFVPSEAVVERGSLRGLFVLDDEDRGRLRWIRTGRAIDDRVEILSGLRPGERYVVAPPLGFVDGTPVRES